MDVHSVSNDYRSNLLVQLYTIGQTINNPVILRYEDWLLEATTGQITIYKHDALLCKYAAQETFLDAKISHKFKIPLTNILKFGKYL